MQSKYATEGVQEGTCDGAPEGFFDGGLDLDGAEVVGFAEGLPLDGMAVGKREEGIAVGVLVDGERVSVKEGLVD